MQKTCGLRTDMSKNQQVMVAILESQCLKSLAQTASPMK